MKLHKKILSIVGVGLLLGSTSLLATQKSAITIINKAYQTMDNMDAYAFDAIVINKMTKKQNNISIKVDRPNKFTVKTKGTNRDRSSYLNNGLFTMMDYNYGYYAQLKTPKNISDALDFLFEKYDINAPLAQLIYSGLDKRVKFKKSKYFGTVTVKNIEYDYVAFKSKSREVHIWITIGEKPVVKYYTIFNTQEDGNPRVNTTIFWKNDIKISDNDFIFTAPKGASKISVLNTK